MEKEIIKRFAVDVLGCGCEQSVFNSIDVDEGFLLNCGVRLSKKILIGRRLLIYIADAGSCAPGEVAAVVHEGLAERDANGYNRLRLVIVTPETGAVLKVYNDAFRMTADKDEKCHIHVLKPGEAV